MLVPLILFLLSAAAGLAALVAVPDDQLMLMAVAALLGGAGLGLMFRRLIRPRRKVIIVDGSNVLHWGGAPALATVTAVVADLKGRGLRPVVWFDANAGYLVADQYLGPASFARRLNLPTHQVFVAPKGTPADPLILKDAGAFEAQVVTNDRYRDWAATHPVAAERGRMVRGRANGEGVELDF